MKKLKVFVFWVTTSTLALMLAACQAETAVEVSGSEAAGPKTFMGMVNEAMSEVPLISAEEANALLEKDPNVLVIDPRDAADIPYTGIIPGAMNISYGSLTWKADQEVPPEWREPQLADRERPIIMACETGELAALSGKLLQDMGFSNVSILEGGTVAWKEAGYAVDEFNPGS
jgi:rhodanese-related sulfurtransferase